MLSVPLLLPSSFFTSCFKIQELDCKEHLTEVWQIPPESPCMYVCMYVRMYVRTYVCIYYIYIYTNVYMYVCMYVCIYIYICMHVYIYIYIYINVYMYVISFPSSKKIHCIQMSRELQVNIVYSENHTKHKHISWTKF